MTKPDPQIFELCDLLKLRDQLPIPTKRGETRKFIIYERRLPFTEQAEVPSPGELCPYVELITVERKSPGPGPTYRWALLCYVAL